MGRIVKRVPLNFEWLLSLTWKGFLNPYNPTHCKICDGSGYNPETKLLSDQWYTHLRSDGKNGWMYHLEQEDVKVLFDEGRLWDFKKLPTAEEVNVWSKKGMGHGGINRWICVKAKAKRLGIYGLCSVCKGKGHYWADDKYEKLYEEFEYIDPPKGKGYQMWETTTEGSPISPVFKTPKLLAKWLSLNNVSIFGENIATYDQWLAMIKN